LKSKEYVFAPSDTPEWEAEKGFELLIGNAGGIVLEFNGKKMDNLGKQGQVVRIKLPEEEERSSARE
jgi:cytoskeleton protein RodZ